ncbi:hypothetical protein CDL15_Pgr021221 [Punica granatum]|nr:hypothetical protein CDL15_Pgr021221 [Punica granatum]
MPRDPKARDAGPDESSHSCPYMDHAILMKKSQEELMSIDKGLSVVLEDLEMFSCKCAREKLGVDDLVRKELPLGNSWVPRPKRRNREKARVSIDCVFEARGSN